MNRRRKQQKQRELKEERAAYKHTEEDTSEPTTIRHRRWGQNTRHAQKEPTTPDREATEYRREPTHRRNHE